MRTMLALVHVAVLAFVSAVHGYATGPIISTEATTNATFDTTMASFYYSSKNASFVGVRNVTIPYYTWSSVLNKDTIIVVPGRGEGSIKYRELLYDFFKNGYNVIGIDQRGQGFSSPRPCPGTQLAASVDFNDYVSDLTTLVDTVKAKGPSSVWPASRRKTYIFAHSMGAAVTALFLENNPGKVNAAVLTGAMLQLNVNSATRTALEQLVAASGTCAFTTGTSTVADTNITETNFLRAATSSRVRWFKNKAIEWGLYPETALAGSAASWLVQAIVGGETARANAAKVTDPILMFLGQNDTAIAAAGITAFCQGTVAGSTDTFPKASNCQLMTFNESRHEVWNERDVIRTPALTAAIEFFKCH